MYSRDKNINIVSRVHHAFYFLKNLLIAHILDEKYTSCSMKIQSNSPHEYIAYRLVLYVLLKPYQIR